MGVGLHAYAEEHVAGVTRSGFQNVPISGAVTTPCSGKCERSTTIRRRADVMIFVDDVEFVGSNSIGSKRLSVVVRGVEDPSRASGHRRIAPRYPAIGRVLHRSVYGLRDHDPIRRRRCCDNATIAKIGWIVGPCCPRTPAVRR